MAAELSGLVSRLEAVTARLENVASSPVSAGSSAGGSTQSEALVPFVVEFDSIISGPVANYVAVSKKIGGDVHTHASLVAAAFRAERDFIHKASKSKEPDQAKLQSALKPTADKLTEISDFRERSRGSSFFNHLSAISESIPALGWVAVSPAPGPFVKELSDAGQFYTNRVLKEFKEKDKTHVDWVKSWLSAMSELHAYVKKHHTTGLSWNKQGGDISQAGGSTPAAAAKGPAPPPPPPPPPASLLQEPISSDGGSKDDGGDKTNAALFADLNKGQDATKGLKKVTDDMKTHKNPGIRLTAQPYKPMANASPKPFKPFKAPKPAESVKPPKCELDGKRWLVEYQHGNKNLVISDTNIKQTVYMYKCENSTIQVKGKINSIVLDSCKKVGVVFEDLLASLEVINSQSVQAQVTGKVRTVSIDKTDGCQVYLSKDSLDCEIVSAKSSEMNIVIPSNSGDFKEFAVPEQFKTVWNGKKLVTESTDIAS